MNYKVLNKSEDVLSSSEKHMASKSEAYDAIFKDEVNRKLTTNFKRYLESSGVSVTVPDLSPIHEASFVNVTYGAVSARLVLGFNNNTYFVGKKKTVNPFVLLSQDNKKLNEIIREYEIPSRS